MGRKGKIAQYREKLDQSLASDNLKDRKKLTNLVRDQILRSSEHAHEGYVDNVVATRTDELANMLDMLRSASEKYETLPNAEPHASWKLKSENEEFRVMYREGPEGSPFHTLLVEGYVDAPVDACLCISWEAELYPTWFPEIRIPTFKVLHAKRLQKIRIGEQISLVRVKLSWPLSNRETLLHYFEFEYFQDDLVIVMLKTIDDVESVSLETHGFSNDEIPEAGQTVRCDMVGGFALQKVSEDTTYFRTIANLDVKLDFVPPSVINFVSRQLIGGAFRLYKKTISSIQRDDQKFWNGLDDTLYKRVVRSMYTQDKPDESTEAAYVTSIQGDANAHTEVEVDVENSCQDGLEKDQKAFNGNHIDNSCSPQDEPARNRKMKSEIEEENEECKMAVEESVSKNHEVVVEPRYITIDLDADETQRHFHADKKIQVSPPVDQAIGTLEKVIHLLRERRKSRHGAQSDFANQVSQKLESIEAKKSVVESRENGKPETIEAKKSVFESRDNGKLETVEAKQSDVETRQNVVYLDTRASQQSSAEEIIEKPSQESHNTRSKGSSSFSDLLNIHKTAKETTEKDLPSGGASPQLASPFVANGSMTPPSSGMSTNNYNTPTPNNRVQENHLTEQRKSGEQKKWRLCCLRVVSGRLVSS